MLPAFSALQTVVVELLPRMLTRLTLLGEMEPRLLGTLLTSIKGSESVPKAATLCKVTREAEAGPVLGATTSRLGIPFPTSRVVLAAGAPMKPLDPTAETESVILFPPRALHLIIIILLTPRALLTSTMLVAPPPLTMTLPARQLTQETRKTVPGGILKAHPLPTLAIALTEAFPTTMPVLTMGLLPPLAIAFATAWSRRLTRDASFPLPPPNRRTHWPLNLQATLALPKVLLRQDTTPLDAPRIATQCLTLIL